MADRRGYTSLYQNIPVQPLVGYSDPSAFIRIREAVRGLEDQVTQIRGLVGNSVPGYVSSVGLTAPTIFSVTGSPVTDTGTIALSLVSQAARSVFAAPTGTAGTPSFRALEAADIQSGVFGITRGGTGLSSTPSNGQLLIGNGSGYTLATLTAGTGITVTNNAGSIQIDNSLPGFLNPMTTLGDIIYGGAAGAATRLGGETTTTRKFLRSVGVAGVATIPAWDTVTKTDVGLSNVENTALSTWAGSTSLTTLGTITTGVWNGTKIDVADGGTGITSYTVGDLLYASATTTLSKLAVVDKGVLYGTATGPAYTAAADLSWDNTNKRLGIGNAAPSYPLHVQKDQNATTYSLLFNQDAGSSARSVFLVNSDVASTGLYSYSSGYTTSGGQVQAGSALGAGGAGGLSIIAFNAAGSIRFYTSSTSAFRGTVSSAGQWGFGPDAASPTTLVSIAQYHNAATTAAVFNTDTGMNASANFILYTTANTGLELTSSGATNPNQLKLFSPLSGGVILEASNASGFLAVATGGTYPSNEKFRIAANGNVTVDSGTLFVDAVNNEVGIGTTSPGERLHVVGLSRFDKTSAPAYPNLRLRSVNDAYASTWAIGQAPSSNNFMVAHNDGATWFEYLTFTTTGNLGIGNITPGAKLEFVNTNATFNTTTPGTTRYATHFRSGATDDQATGITWAGNNGTQTAAHAGIYVQSSGSYGTKMYFATTNSYAMGAQTAMTIDHNRFVGVGVAPSYRFHVSESYTGAGGNVTTRLNSSVSPAAANTNVQYGVFNTLVVNANATGSARALYSVVQHRGASNTGVLSGGWFGIDNDDAATMGSTISDAVAIYAMTPSQNAMGGTISRSYGLFVQAQSGTNITNSFGIYQTGSSDKNIFAGSVRIGSTTNPTTVLDVIQTTAGTAAVNMSNSSADPAANARYILNNSATSGGLQIRSTGHATEPSDLVMYSTANNIRFYTGGNFRMSVGSTGNILMDTNTFFLDAANNRIGLGTITPQTRLHIDGTAATLSTTLYNSVDTILAVQNGGTGARLVSSTGTPTTITNVPALVMLTSRGTVNAATTVSSGDYLGRVVWQGLNTTPARNDSSEIRAAVDAAPGAGNVPGRLEFWTAGTGASTERMRIDDGGNVIINTAALATSATDGFLHISTMAGTPTAAPPTTYTGRVPVVYDTTNNKLYVYNGGWKAVTLA